MRWTKGRQSFRSATRQVRLAGLEVLCILLLSGNVSVTLAQDATARFEAACTRSATLMGISQSQPEGLERLCECLSADFGANLSSEDIDTLSRDLLGELTPQQRAANPDYERLSTYGGQAVSACLMIEGFEDGARAPQVQ